MEDKRFGFEQLPPEIQAKADRMNLSEDAVPPYDVPQLPITENMSAAGFEQTLKPHLLAEFYRSMYGIIPPVCESVEYHIRHEGFAFNKLAIRREVDIICRHKGDEQTLHMLLYLPAERRGKVPVFFGLNFRGNIDTTVDEDAEFIPFDAAPPLWSLRYDDGRVTAENRGEKAYRFDFEKVLKRGFGSATICYQDIYLDRPDGFAKSIMRFFYSADEWNSKERDSGAISAWAWGIMRALDYLEKQPEIDPERLIVHGHSRLGKTALWAGANDPRIWLTVSNCSGTGGAKLSHRYYGEDFSWLEVWNKHWFTGKFPEYVDRDLEYPVDQHFLMAAIAPRLLYIASADKDFYADPRGEYLSGVYASPAWNIYGKKALEDTVYPECGKLTGDGSVGYYLRAGEHEFMPENWDALLSFTEKHL